MENDEIIAIAEEERFTRDKQALDTFPYHSIEWVLEHANITFDDVDVISIGRDPRKYLQDIYNQPTQLVPTSVTRIYSSVKRLGRLAAAFSNYPVQQVKQDLNEYFSEDIDAEIYTVSHHRCHAASAAYCADSERPIVLTVDAKGEHDSTVLWDRDLNRQSEFSARNSIGYFYTYGTKYLGYRYGRDAGKIMGLASYGSYREEYAAAFDDLVSIDEGEYDVTAITAADDPIKVLERQFGDRRVYPAPFTDRHEDFAYHLQLKTEEILVSLVEHLVEETGVREIALAGGVAMNCKANRVINELDCVDDLFIQPASNDSGICLGAALEGYRRRTDERPTIDFNHVYYGPGYSAEEIVGSLDSAKLNYQEVNAPKRGAELLAEGNLVGWFQGRMEYGARALGNRSILANPTDPDTLDKVNKNVKNREPWRPFAPSILSESKNEYLEYGDESPYMIILDDVIEDKQDEVPAIVHTDGTTRPQTVRKDANPRYYRLIKEFGDITGVPIVLNTSFNVSGEPIVRTPEQAIQDFFVTGLDALIIGEYLLTK